MNYKQKTRSRIKKWFLLEIYKDIISTICFIVGVIFIPIMLSQNFTPNLIAEQGYIIGWFYWIVGIGICIGFIIGLGGLITVWLDSRWEKAKEKVKDEMKK